MTDTNTKPPVLFIHGLWIHAAAWQPWIRMFEEAGHDASAPAGPGTPRPSRRLARTRSRWRESGSRTSSTTTPP